MDRSGWDATSWVDQELAGSTFKDERLGRRLRKLLARMAGAVVGADRARRRWRQRGHGRARARCAT
jgi:hypothetical protein